MNQPIDHLPDTLIPPGPSPELRQRVLVAARAAMDRSDLPDSWMRIWRNRPARLAWAVSIGALIFGHLVIGGSVSTGSAEPALPFSAAVGTNDELAEIVGLQRVTVDLPRWELLAREPVTPTNTPTESEDLS